MKGSEGVVDVPLPRGGGPPGPPYLLTKNRSFLWLVLGDSFAQLARWGFFLVVIGDATYRLHANAAEVALLRKRLELRHRAAETARFLC